MGHSCMSHTGWQRPIRCLELQVISRKRATNYRALLRKMTYKDKASYGSSPPCINYTWAMTIIHESYQLYITHTHTHTPCTNHTWVMPNASTIRALLRKMTYKDKAFYGSSPPCTNYTWVIPIIHGSYQLYMSHAQMQVPYVCTVVYVYADCKSLRIVRLSFAWKLTVV